LAAAFLVGAVATSCAPDPSGGTAISMFPPGLFPAFDRSVSDYVTRCGEPTTVSVNVGSGTTVSIDGQPARSGSFTADVARGVGQRFTIVVHDATGPPTTHHVRCLPPDFPPWRASRTGTPQAEYYLTVPGSAIDLGDRPVIFDTNGVPLWWGRSGRAFSASLLPDGNLGWTPTAGGGLPAEERTLDGTLVRTIDPAFGSLDSHDLQVLPNGDTVIVAITQRSGVDLSWACAGTQCGPANATIEDAVIQELAPDGRLVWSWDVADHIPVSEFDPQFALQELALGAPYGVYHWNSIEYTGSGFIVSFRHLNAIYNIDQATGEIVWKLGGTPRPESLTVLDDPMAVTGVFHGQHDPRLLSDGTVTVHDNGTQVRSPRAVRYRIDTTTTPGTATLVEQVTDPAIAGAICCGSARKLPGGNWVIGWGGNNTITEASPDGTRVFALDFLPFALGYRAFPILPGQLDRAALRAGMDAQYAN
jgi:hypothetical protein